MSSNLWVYAGDGAPSAPVTVEQLAELFTKGDLTRDTRIRPADVDSWAPLWVWLPRIAEPAPDPTVPPPLPVRKGGWSDSDPHPWRRYFARMFDGVIVGTLAWSIISIVSYQLAPEAADAFFTIFDTPGGRLFDIVLTLLITIPGTALMIGLTGISIGKWVFGVKVIRRDGRPIGVIAALKREIQVWFLGLACGFPLVSLVALVLSYRRLSDKGHAFWDDPAQRIVLHRPMNLVQVTLIVLGIPALIAFRLLMMSVG